MFDGIIVTCEHAGNRVPDKYCYLFKNNEEILSTHRAIDFGALEIARELSSKLKAPFFYTTISRLLIEANRSTGKADLFSEFSKALPEKEKKAIADNYYHPYRNKVEEAIAKKIKSGKKVLHLSMHTFTPVFNMRERNCDIGLLFDPKRPSEKKFCTALKKQIEKKGRKFIVRFNYPYKGTADGFTTSLRKKYKDDAYAGIEIEVNQRFPLCSSRKEWEKLNSVLTKAIADCL